MNKQILLNEIELTTLSDQQLLSVKGGDGDIIIIEDTMDA